MIVITGTCAKPILVDKLAAGLEFIANKGGSITATLFLKQCVDEKVQWMHIYLTGPVWSDKKKNATIFGVSTMMEWVLKNSSSYELACKSFLTCIFFAMGAYGICIYSAMVIGLDYWISSVDHGFLHFSQGINNKTISRDSEDLHDSSIFILNDNQIMEHIHMKPVTAQGKGRRKFPLIGYDDSTTFASLTCGSEKNIDKSIPIFYPGGTALLKMGTMLLESGTRISFEDSVMDFNLDFFYPAGGMLLVLIVWSGQMFEVFILANRDIIAVFLASTAGFFNVHSNLEDKVVLKGEGM